MIHIDLNHPIDAMRRQVEVSILTGDGIEYETVLLQQIQWDTVDAEKDTVMVSSEGSEPKVAVYSTMHFPVVTTSKFELDMSEYGQSIAALMKLAKGDTHGSKVAAEVLLSAYNGTYFQLSIPSLCSLDEKNYRHAITVIHGRKATFQEPQSFIDNGDDQFSEIWEQWKGVLHVEERFKSMCQSCYGTGKKQDEEGESTSVDCWHCDGYGKILPDGLEYSKR